MLTFYDQQDPYASQRHAYGRQSCNGVGASISHELYPGDIVDPATGFRVEAGYNIFVHLDEGHNLQTTRDRTSRHFELAKILGEVAATIKNVRGESGGNILSATHQAMALVALNMGFR